MRRSVSPAAASAGTASIVRSRSSEPSSAFTSRSAPVTWRPSGIAPGLGEARRASRRCRRPGRRPPRPHGIQPDPNRASRRTTRGLMVPLTQTGTPPGWRGFGIMWMASKCSSGES